MPSLRFSDLRGIARLATEATTGVSRVAEGVHQSVWSAIGAPGGETPGQARGITGLVYRSVRGITLLVGECLDAALAGLQLLSEPAEADSTSPRREAVLAALNGVMGDHLVASDNPLATPMSLRYRREALDWEAMPPASEVTGKVLLLIHGLCMNDLQWQAGRKGREVDHGRDLAAALGYTPLYLRYNSGLHTSDNGRELSVLLESLVARWPRPVEELSVLAHSIGGLVIRSAVDRARHDAARWPDHLKSVVFLGTPHHGAPLERIGSWVDVILAATPFTAPFAGLGHLRSCGITDLRYGYVLEEQWRGRDRFDAGQASLRAVPLPGNVACHTVAATLGEGRSALADRLTGDGLVPLRSALGEHDDPRRSLGFAPESQWIARGTGHIELLGSPRVTRRIARWLAS